MRNETRADIDGTRLDPHRDWESKSPVPNAFLPATAMVLLKQHAGRPARCVVGRGDTIREGMVLGVPDGEGSAFVHSPIPGTVRSISTIRLPGGAECEAVEILLRGGFDRLGKRPERYVWKGMRKFDILQALKSKGVVETGGRGMPLDSLLESSARRREILIYAIDTEPYLRTEAAVFASRAEDTIEAARIVASVIDASGIRVLVGHGFEASESDRESSSRQKDTDGLPVEFVHTDGARPAATRGKAAGREGMKNGNQLRLTPSSLVAVYDAVVEAKAFVERYLTVAGGAIRHPSVLKARIGTPIGDLVEECGGFLESPERLVLGGPLTGLPARDLDMPVTKTMGAVLALTPQETRRGKVRPCIRCGRCREICPVGIDPETIFRSLSGGRLAEARVEGLGSCISCGLCSYICPSRIELSQSFAAQFGAAR